MGNNKAKEELSEKRRAEISEIEGQIKDIDKKISLQIRIKSQLQEDDRQQLQEHDRQQQIWSNPGGFSSLPPSGNGLLIGSADAEISKLRSEREILVNKVTVLYKIEQEYQNKK